jgi:DNA-binding transcriptional LysR family regulator
VLLGHVLERGEVHVSRRRDHRVEVLEFQALYPRVEVELDLSVQRRDLVAEGYDVAHNIDNPWEESCLETSPWHAPVS